MKNPFTAEYRITSPYGTRTLNGAVVNHSGVDLVCDKYYTVVSTDAGTVASSTIITDKSNKTWEWGNYVQILTDDGRRVFYCHLASRDVKKGDRVEVGTVLGRMGNTGYSFGAHLHYEVRKGNKTLNAAEYLGIINNVGKAVEIPMTKDEILNTIGDQFIETFEQLPEWAKPTVKKWLDDETINGGTDKAIKADDINMFMSDIKTLIIAERLKK